MADFATIIGSVSGVVADVDTDRRLFAQVRVPAFGGLGVGSYRRAAGQQTITTVSYTAGKPLAGLRWNNTDRMAVLQSIKIGIVTATTITSGVQFDVSAVIQRQVNAGSFATASPVDLDPSQDMNSMRTGCGVSAVQRRLFITGATWDCVVAPAAAVLGNPGTGVEDATAAQVATYIAYMQGFAGTVVGTQWFGGYGLSELYVRDDCDAHPVVLAQGDMAIVQSVQTGPATGSFGLTVQFEWGEVPAY